MDPESTVETSNDSPVDEMTIGEALDTIAARGHGGWMAICILSLSVSVCVNAVESGVAVYVAGCVKTDFAASGSDIAMITSANAAGQILGSFLLCPLADVHGRRTCLIWWTAGVAVFAFLQAFSPTLTSLMLCRLVIGIFQGPLIVGLDYIIEVVSTENRGRIITWVSTVAWGVGSLCLNLMAWLIVPHYGYRTLLAISAIPFAFSVWLCVALLVESPRWLLVKGRTEEALAALTYIAEANGTTVPCRSLLSQADEWTPIKGETDESLSSLGQKMLEEYHMLVEKTGFVLMLALSGSWLCLGFVYTAIVLFQGDLQGAHKSMGPCQFDYGFISITSACEIFGAIVSLPLIDRPDLSFGGRKGTQNLGYLLTAVGIVLAGFKLGSQLKLVIACLTRAAVNAATGVTVMHGPEAVDVTVRGTGSGYLNGVLLIGGLLAPYWIFTKLSIQVIAFGIAAVSVLTIVFVSFTPETALVELDTPAMRRQATPETYDDDGKPRTPRGH